MRRHILSSRRRGRYVWCERDYSLPFALCFSIRTLSGSQSLFGDSVHTMRSVFSSQKRCNPLSALFSLRMDQVRNGAVALC